MVYPTKKLRQNYLSLKVLCVGITNKSTLGTSRRTEAIALAREMKLISDDATTHFNNVPIPDGAFWGRQDEIAS